MKIIKKIFNLFLVFVMFFTYVLPVYALTPEQGTKQGQEQTTVKLSDKIEALKAGFNQKLSIEDSIKITYSTSFNAVDYFKNILKQKINDNNINIDITNTDNNKVSYTLTGYDDTYSGSFTYEKTLSIELSDTNTDTIKNYFKNILGNVEVTPSLINGNSYKVTINGRSETFNITGKAKIATINNHYANIKYQTHIQDIGWQNFVSNGTKSGTSGKSKRLEGIKINIDSNVSGSIKYQTHIQDIGWQTYKNEGSLSGTTGKSKRLEAIRIKLTGDLEKEFDIYYRVHIQDYGDLGWAKNGEMAGSMGLSKRLESIYIKVVRKDQPGPTDHTNACAINNNMYLAYQAHVAKVGWQNTVTNGATAGKTGNNIEALKIAINNVNTDGSIVYKAHVANVGWQGQVANGAQAGTTGRSLATEAININLTGSLKEEYDIYYRVYVAGKNTWLAWTKNGANAGSTGAGQGIQAIQIKLVEKDTKGPSSSGASFIDGIPHISYNTYTVSNARTKNASDGSSTTRNSGIKGIDIALKSDFYSGSVQYQVKTKNGAWTGNVVSGQIFNEPLEAIKMNLTGEIASKYNIYYRVYATGKGWLSWTKNGGKAGSQDLGMQIEAIEIKLVDVKAAQPSTSVKSFLTKEAKIYYQAHVSNVGWQNKVAGGAQAGTTGQSRAIEAIKIGFSETTLGGSIQYEVNVGHKGWQKAVSNGTQAGTTGQSLKLEGIKIRLTGEISNYYDIYYQAHIQNVGWTNWAKNGGAVGTSGAGYRIEALKIQLVQKDKAAPGKTGATYYEGSWSTGYYPVLGLGAFKMYKDAFGKYADDFKYIDGKKYFFNGKGYLITNNAKRIIDVSSHNGTINWDAVKTAGRDDERGEVDGVIVKVASSVKKDTQAERNIKELNRLSIPYGIYLYSYANDASGGVLDANLIIDAINSYPIKRTYPIYYDLEPWGSDAGYANKWWNFSTYQPIIDAFASKMKEKNLPWEIYANADWAQRQFVNSKYANKLTWIAHYSTHFLKVSGGSVAYNVGNSYKMWQYTSSDYVTGISGRVDSNVYGNFTY